MALSVLGSHCGGIFGVKGVGGQIAVQSFFIISGFYMSLILNEKYVGANGSYKLFITNRFARLFPIYFAVLLLAIIGLNIIDSYTDKDLFSILTYYRSAKMSVLSLCYFVLTHIFIFGQDLAMFMGISKETGNLFFASNFRTTNPLVHQFLFIRQAWSLSLELMFYLIAPFILKRKMKFVLLIIAASLLLRVFIYHKLGLQMDPWTYRFFPTELMFFLFGHISYQIYVWIKKSTVPYGINLLVLFFMIFFTIFYRFIPSSRESYLAFTFKDFIYFSSIILSIPLLFKFFKTSKFDNQIGELSYPIYLIHLLISDIIITLDLLPRTKSGWQIALISIFLSILLNKFIAAPVEKYRQSRLVLSKPNKNGKQQPPLSKKR